MNKVLCKLGFHHWKYPIKTKSGGRWVRGVHRICTDCKLEETRVMFGGWVTDFPEY